MDSFFEILKYCIPAIVVFCVVWVMMSKFLKREEIVNRYYLLRASQKTTLPIRLTAYERMVLFLERISPESLLPRMQDDSLDCLQLHAALLQAIRAEYEHNVAQQVYLSDEAWAVIKNAKENIVQLINACAANVESQKPSMELAKLILATYQQNDVSPTAAAIAYLKAEIKSYFS